MKRFKFPLILLCLTFTFFSCPDDDLDRSDGIFRLAYDFHISEGRLYTANTNEIRAFGLANPTAPDLLGSTGMDRPLSLLFVSEDFGIVSGNLYSGTFPLNANGVPEGSGEDNFYFDACLPVVANETHFFAVANAISGCSSRTNGNFVRIIAKTFPLPPESEVINLSVADPQDVALAGTLLFVADGLSGLKIFSIEDLQNIQLLAQRSDLVAQRVQVSEGLLTLVTNDRLMVFDYANPEQPLLLSEILL